MSLPTLPTSWADLAHVSTAQAVAVAGALTLLAVLALLARRSVKDWGRAAETGLTVLAAGIATGLSLNGMWRVFGDVLHLDGPARVATVGYLEIALIVSAIRARRTLRQHGTAGVDGAAVWAIAVLSALLAASDADGLAKAVRLAAPLLAAWLWERGLAADRRAVRSHRPVTIAWRWTHERLAVRLGLADPAHRDTPDADRAWRLARLTRARLRLAVLESTTLPRPLALATARPVRLAVATWRLQRQALAAVEHLHLGTDPALPGTIRTTVAAVTGLRAATAPAALSAASPWRAVGERDHDDSLTGHTDARPAIAPAACATAAIGQNPAGDRSPPRPARREDVTPTRTAGARSDTAAAVTRVADRHPDWSTQTIADRLGLSARTVRRHLAVHRTPTTDGDPSAA